MQTLLNYVWTTASLVTMAVVGWAFTLSNRVTAVETSVADQPNKDADLKEFIKDLMDAKFDGVNARLARIEANGNGKVPHV